MLKQGALRLGINDNPERVMLVVSCPLLYSIAPPWSVMLSPMSSLGFPHTVLRSYPFYRAKAGGTKARYYRQPRKGYVSGELSSTVFYCSPLVSDALARYISLEVNLALQMNSI